MNMPNLKFAKQERSYQLFRTIKCYKECKEPYSRYHKNNHNIRFEVPEKLLKKAHENDVQALFQISYLACEDDRLGLAREFLRLAFEASQSKHSTKAEIKK